MLNPDFKEFAELLNAHRVDYLVVGGYALAAHGHSRYTGDIDLWIDRTDPNIERLLAALRDFGSESLGLPVADFGPDAVIQLGQPPRRIDLLMGIDGVQFTDCHARREVIVVDGVALSFIGLDDFKQNKRATGRLKDLADLEALDDKASP